MEKEIRNDVKGIGRFIFETGADRERSNSISTYPKWDLGNEHIHRIHTMGRKFSMCFLGKVRYCLEKRHTVSQTMKPFTLTAKSYTGYATSVRRRSAML